MNLRPTATQERWLLLSLRLGDHGGARVEEGMAGWRTVGLVTRCAFFLLGFILAVATCGILFTMSGSDFWLAAGIVLWSAGEGLIAKRRVHAAGLEEALIAMGLALTAFGITETFGPIESKGSVLAVGIGLGVAGLRLLNPLVTTLAALTLSLSVAQWLEFPILGSGPRSKLAAVLGTSFFCYAAGAVALALGARVFARPSVDRMLDWLVVVMPVAGYFWLQIGNSDAGDTLTPIEAATLIAPLFFAIAAFIVGLRLRSHAPLLAGLLALACAGHALHELSDVPAWTALIVAGVVALAVAALLDRKLSQPRGRISSAKLEDSTLLDLAEATGATVLPPALHEAPAPRTFESGGGGFGGGGASGRY